MNKYSDTDLPRVEQQRILRYDCESSLGVPI